MLRFSSFHVFVSLFYRLCSGIIGWCSVVRFRYLMINLFVILPLAALFMLINLLLGCYVAIRLGYGPPHWILALNLVVPATTFQNRLNEWRDWLEQKSPWIERLLLRWHVPKPMIFVDITAKEEGEKEELEEEAESKEKSEEEKSEEDTDDVGEESAVEPTDSSEDAPLEE